MRVVKDQRGVLNPLLIVLVVVVLAVGGLAFWKVSNNKDGKSSTSAAKVNNAAAESACNKEVNDKTFCKFVAHFSLASEYKTEVTSTDDKGTVSKSNLESDSKGNTSMVLRDANGKETGAFITIGNDSYVKDEADGSWSKYSAAPSETEKPTSDIKIDTNDVTEKNTVTYKNLGTEACGKLTCYKYQVVDSENTGTTQYIWFDNKDYLMRRWSSKDASGSTDMTFTYTKVTINVPSPVKAASTPNDVTEADVNAAIQAAQAAANSDE